MDEIVEIVVILCGDEYRDIEYRRDLCEGRQRRFEERAGFPVVYVVVVERGNAQDDEQRGLR